MEGDFKTLKSFDFMSADCNFCPFLPFRIVQTLLLWRENHCEHKYLFYLNYCTMALNLCVISLFCWKVKLTTVSRLFNPITVFLPLILSACPSATYAANRTKSQASDYQIRSVEDSWSCDQIQQPDLWMKLQIYTHIHTHLLGWQDLTGSQK